MAGLPAADLETAEASKRETAREFWLDGDVEAINQTTLSAQTQGQVEEILFEELGDKRVRLAMIGPGGEKMVRYACVMNDVTRAAGRDSPSLTR